MSHSSTLPRLSAMLQSSAIPYGAHQFATGQYPRRKPTIGAPDVVLTAQPSASLKRRSHIRRSSRSGNSPTESNFTSSSEQPLIERTRPQVAPLTTAFTRSITATSSTVSAITWRPTLMEPPTIEWRDAPRYQPKVSSRAELSRRSTVASVYSLPSAGPHDSRQSTQENFVVDWSFVDQALRNRDRAPISPSHSSQGYRQLPTPSDAPGPSRGNSISWGPQAGLSRINTSHVRSLLLDRRRGYHAVPESPAEY